MENMLSRFVEDLTGRLGGQMKFRLILQPVMAAVFAVRSGLKDSKEGNPPYFWALFSDPGHREALLQDGWKSVGRVFILGIVIDVIYQLTVFGRFYAVEALVVAAVLALVPYLLIRGPVTRITRRKP